MSDLHVVTAARHGRQRRAKSGALVWAVGAAVLAVTSLAFGETLPTTFTDTVKSHDVLGAVGPVTQFSGAMLRRALKQQASDVGQESAPRVRITGLPRFAAAVDGGQQSWGETSFDTYWFFKCENAAGKTELEKLTVDYSGPRPTAVGFVDETPPTGTGSRAVGDVASTGWMPSTNAVLAYADRMPMKNRSPSLMRRKLGSEGKRMIDIASATGLQLAYHVGSGSVGSTRIDAAGSWAAFDARKVR